MDLRRAVSWSSRFSAFNWWLRSRQSELQLSKYLVIPGPGSSRQFHIERKSTVAESFANANRSLGIPVENMRNISRIRILTLPQEDGASAKWHPVSLGHELAHLRYTEDWILQWMAGLTNARNTGAQAVAKARMQLATEDPDSLPEPWFSHLTRWLIETACDATLFHFYGDKALPSMRTFLGAHSYESDSQKHPAPDIRIAALQASQQRDMRRFRAANHEPSIHFNRKNAFCDLVLKCRDAVRADLAFIGLRDDVRRDVHDKALTAESKDAPPQSVDWEWPAVLEDLSAIEAGIIGSLWTGIAESYDVDATALVERSRTLKRRERRVEQAVDFLQFAHRFEKERVNRAAVRDANPHQSERSIDETPTNVLYVSRRGVSTNSNDVGLPSTDVRLGRHFIVFKRNQIAVLNTLDTNARSRQVQEAVEIGWGQSFVLHPHELVLAVTLETLVVDDDCTAQVLSRSSLGRMGLLSATAVQVQPGFRGTLTLELVNLASVPLGLTPGQRLAQIVPAVACGTGGYGGKYQDQDWRPKFSEVLRDVEMPILAAMNEWKGKSNVQY